MGKPRLALHVRATRTWETSNQSCDTSVETLESWQCGRRHSIWKLWKEVVRAQCRRMETQTGLATLADSAWVALRHGHEANLVGTRHASSRKQSTIARSSGEAELVAPLPGACECMSLRQQWNWLLKFGCSAEETSETTQQILCCDSTAAVGMIKRKGSTRKTRHIELKVFFLQQWSARPEVRLVQVGTSEMLAATKIHSTPNSIHLSRLELDIKSSLEQIWTEDRAEEVCRNSTRIFRKFSVFFSFPFSVGRITRSTKNSEFILSTQLHILTDQVLLFVEFWIDGVLCGGDDWRFDVVLLFAVWWIPVKLFTRLAELQVAHEERHVYKFDLEVTDYTCPVLLMENTFPVHVTVETTQNIVEVPTVQDLVIWLEIPECQVLTFELGPNSQVRTCGEELHVNRNSSYFLCASPCTWHSLSRRQC